MVRPRRNPEHLSDVAWHLLQKAPERFKRGKIYSCRELADITGYGKSQVNRALIELRVKGFVAGVPFGKTGRYQYTGVPSMMLHPERFPRRQAA